MTLNRGFNGFFGDYGLRDIFQKQIAQKAIEIHTEKLHRKFLALNIDSDGPNLDFLGSRKPAHMGIKEQYPRKDHYFTFLGQSFVKTVADSMGMLPITTSTSDKLFSPVNIR